MALSNTQKHAMLDTLDGKYISLHTGDPSTTGANEVTGGSYARQLEALAAASGGSKTNSGAAIDFTGMPTATVTHFGVWDASSGGNFLWGGALIASKSVTSGDTFRFPTSSLTFSVS